MKDRDRSQFPACQRLVAPDLRIDQQRSLGVPNRTADHPLRTEFVQQLDRLVIADSQAALQKRRTRPASPNDQVGGRPHDRWITLGGRKQLRLERRLRRRLIKAGLDLGNDLWFRFYRPIKPRNLVGGFGRLTAGIRVPRTTCVFCQGLLVAT